MALDTGRVAAREPASPVADWVRRWALAAALEGLIMYALFTGYERGRLLVRGRIDDAFSNAVGVWHAERVLHLPSEASIQHAVLGWQGLVHAANVFYVGAHLPVTLLVLFWLFVWHRDCYRWIRTAMVLLTGMALALHALVPVAPPRMLPAYGFVDTMHTVGPSLYESGPVGGVANQFAAMPSLHVGWAVLVAVAVVTALRSPWRWLAVLYPVVTVAVVTITANHYFADGLVALLLLAGSLAASTWWCRRRGVDAPRLVVGPARVHARLS